MSPVPIYQIGCPNGHTTDLPETMLEGIIQHLRGSYTGEPVLNFVCSECKTAFHYDYQNRVLLADRVLLRLGALARYFCGREPEQRRK